MAAPKRKPKKKKKNKLPSWLIFILVIIFIALVSMGIGYILTNNNSWSKKELLATEEKVKTETQAEVSKKAVEKTPLEGSWVSYYDGAILTFTGLNFVLELPSVDSPEKITGRIAIENTIVTFFYTSGKKSCIDIEGHYQFTFEEGELNFKVIKDQCPSRKERMSANWFKL